MRKNIVHNFLDFSLRFAVPIVIFTIVSALVMGFFALKIKINSDVQSLIPGDEKITRIIKKYEGNEIQVEYFVIAVESDGLFSIEKLRAFETAINRIKALPGFRLILNPFELISFEKKGKKLTLLPMAKGNRAPLTQKELELFKSRLLGDKITKKLVISDDGRVLSAYFSSKKIKNYKKYMDDINLIVKDLKNHFQVYISGSIPFSSASKKFLAKDFPILISLAILFILFLYFASFRSIRAIVLPLSVVVIGTLWALGFMCILGFQLTIISIIMPPLVLTLGSSYSIHILSEYYRQSVNSGLTKSWITKAVDHVNKTVLLASATTVIGFLSLLATSMKQTKEFGISASIGIASCAFLSIFFLPAALSLLKNPGTGQQKRARGGMVIKAMEQLSRMVLKFRIPIIFFLTAIVIIFLLTFRHVGYQSDYTTYFPEKSKVIRDYKVIIEKLGGFHQINITFTAPENKRNYFLNSNVLKQIGIFEEKLEKNPDIYYSISFSSILKKLNKRMTGKYEIPDKRGLSLLLSRYFKTLLKTTEKKNLFTSLVNSDFTSFTISLRPYNSKTKRLLYEKKLQALIDLIQRDLDETIDPSLKPEIWGRSLRFLSLSNLLNNDQRKAMLFSMFLILIVSSIAFRSIKSGFFSLIPMVTGIMLNFILMVVFNIPFDMTTIMVSSVAIGIGVDDSIHFLLQFRKQEKNYQDISMILSESLKITGRPILLTSASIVGGLMILAFSSFLPIIFFGILVSLALATTTIGCLIILPAILAIDWKIRKGGGSSP